MQHQAEKRFFYLLIGLCSLLIAACGPSTGPSASPGGEQTTTKEERPAGERLGLEEASQRGGKFTMPGTGTFGNPNDPHLVITATGRTYAIPATNGIVKRDLYDSNNTIIADLAEKWEASKDGLSYTFKLRQGIKFHNVPPVNGRELTAEDAKYSLLRIIADPSTVPEKNRPRFQRKTDFGSIKSIETPDKYTLVVNIKESFAPFMDSMAHAGTVVLPKEFVDKFEGGFITEGMIGTGPYITTEYKNQQIASYKRNPDYWKKDSKGNQLPYLDELHFIYFADIQAQVASFRARQLDATASSLDINNGMIDAIKKADPNVKVLFTPKVNLYNFRFNTKFKPFQDARVRRAIHLAIDRYQFLELLGEGRGVLSGPITPIYKDLANTTDWLLAQPGYRKDKKEDIQEARRLMKEAGYGDGLTMNAMFTTGTLAADWASLLADQLKAIGITITPEQVDYAGVWVPRSVNGEFELSYMQHVYNLDADSVITPHVGTGGGRNYGKFSDPKLDDLLGKQRVAVTVEERRKWAQEAEKYILEVAPMTFIYAPSLVMLVQPWAHNVADGPVSGQELDSVERAWVEKR